MEQIFLYARDSLPTTRKSTRQQPCVDEALQCVQMLVDTYGAELTDQVRELLPRLFGAEIGEPHGCRCALRASAIWSEGRGGDRSYYLIRVHSKGSLTQSLRGHDQGS